MTNYKIKVVAWLLAGASVLLLATGLYYFLFAAVSPRPLAGNTEGDFAVDASGAAQYSISLAVPPGTNGLAPQLSLAYSTNSGNGIAGIDVQLTGLSAISRTGATPAQDGFRGGVSYDSLDRFSLDGSRLMAVNFIPYGQNGSEYHTEIESYTKVVAQGQCGSGPCSFWVWEKDGTQKEYGTSTDAQVLAVGADFQSGAKKGSVSRWLLNKITDNNGNSLTISYQQGLGVNYPKTIAYTANDTAPARRKVHFYYETRSDTAAQFQGGAVSQVSLRLTALRTFVFTSAADSSLVKEYDLRYESNTPLNISRLQCLTEKTATGDSLPPITFQWAEGPNTILPSQTTAWSGAQSNSGYTGDFNGDGRTDIFGTNSMVYLATEQGFDQGTSTLIPFPAGNLVNTADFNGDGLADLFIGLGTQGKIYFSDEGYFSNTNYQAVSGLSIPTALSNVGMGDFNGDGLPDIFSFIETTAYLSLGNLEKGLLPAFPIPHLDVNQGVNFYADYNADGRTDILSCGSGGALLFLANTDLRMPFQTGIPVQFQMSISASQNWLGDYNGDGSSDLLTFDAGTQAYYLYFATGAGFTSGKPLPNLNLQQPAIYPADYNGDGLMDIYAAGNDGGILYRSNGLDFSDTSHLSLSYQPQYSYLGDFNGDGATDLFSTYDKGISYAGNTQRPTATTNQAMNLLVGISNGIKGDIALRFQPITDKSVYKKGKSDKKNGVELLHLFSNFAPQPLANVQVATCPVISVQNPMYVVSAYWQTDGRGATYAYSYHYADAKYDMEGYGFLGFARQWTYDSSTQSFNYVHFQQQFPLTGNQDTSKSYTFQNQPLSYNFTSYKTDSQSLVPKQSLYVVNTFSQTAQNFNEGESTPAYSTFLFYQYDTFGNVILRADYGNLAAKRRLYTINAYTNNTSKWALGYLTQSTVATDSLGKNLLSQMRIAYDPKGNVQTQSDWDSQEERFWRTAYGYDNYGNVLFTVNPAGDTAYTQYDALYHSFPVKQISPPNEQGRRLVSQTQYEPGFGNLLQTTDPNQLTSYKQYDGLGRLVATQVPDNQGKAFTTVQNFFLRDTVGYVKGTILYRDWNGSKTDTSYNFLDGLGRNYLGVTTGFQGQKLAVEAVFNSKGKIRAQSLAFAKGQTASWSYMYYNAKNLPYRIVHPFGEGDSTVLLLTYRGMNVSVLQAANTADSLRSSVQYDIFNAKKRPVAFTNPLLQTTRFQYDVLGRMTQATDPQNITTACEWNSLGENTWIYTPSSDTTFYQTFDSLRLSWVISPNGDTLLTRQDRLGRCVSQRQSLTDSILFQYDLEGVKNGLGNLCKIIQGQGISFDFSYNNQSQVNQKVSQFGGKTFVENFEFNPDQSPAAYTYPDSSVLKYTYTAQGLIQAIGIRNGQKGNFQTAVSFQDYDNWSRPTQYQYGNQLTTRNRYDASGSLAASYTFSAQNSPLAALLYTQNYLHLFTEITDSLAPNLSRAYGYDPVGRIVRETSKAKTDSLAFDASGNLTFADSAARQYKNYQLQSAKNTQNQGFSLAYDQAGNSISKTAFKSATDSVRYRYSFNAWNLLDSVWDNKGLLYTFLYDYTGSRIQKTNHLEAITTSYVSGNYIYESSAKGIVKEKMVAGDQGLYAVWRTANGQSSPLYYHSNALSNTQFTTNAQGEQQSIYTYSPFGAPQLRQGGMPRFLFNGKELDSLSQLYYFQARYYDFTTSRFLTADDRLGGKLLSTDALNRYAFAHNNPISFADFSGHGDGDEVVEIGALVFETVLALGTDGAAIPGELEADAEILTLEDGTKITADALDFSDNAAIEEGDFASDEEDFLEEGYEVDNKGCVRRSKRKKSAPHKWEPYNFRDAPKRPHNRTPKDAINAQKRISEGKREALWEAAARNPRPYAKLDPSRFSIGPSQEFTQKQKMMILRENYRRNGNKLIDDITGQQLLWPKKCQSGVKPSYFEAQIDHFFPYKHGGKNSFMNAIVTSRYMNGWKSGKLIRGVADL